MLASLIDTSNIINELLLLRHSMRNEIYYSKAMTFYCLLHSDYYNDDSGLHLNRVKVFFDAILFPLDEIISIIQVTASSTQSLIFHFFIFLVTKLFLCFSPYQTKVWAIADSKREGYLGFKEFVISMQVILFIKKKTLLDQTLMRIIFSTLTHLNCSLFLWDNLATQ